MKKDIRLVIRAKNNLILERMEMAGFATVQEVAKAIGDIHPVSLYALVSMRAKPRTKTGKWTPTVIKLAEVLMSEPEDLFSEWQIANTISESNSSITMSSEDLVSLSDQSLDTAMIEAPEDTIIHDQKFGKERIRSLMAYLPMNLQRVLELRSGINGEREHTLVECGRILKVSNERIRQLEARAYRLIRDKAGASVKRTRRFA